MDDDDEAGIVLSKASLGPAEGSSAGESYTVRLSSQPTATTTVTITGHSGTDLTLTGPTGGELTFTSSNWSTAQTVTVKAAQDDDAVNDKETLTHTGEGGDYDGLTRDLPVTVDDDEEAGIVLSKASLGPAEGSSSGESYTVKLSSEPTATITITLSGHSGTDLTLTGPTSNELTFASSNWSTAQTVTVKAAQDADAYGDTATLTHTASGGDYQGVVKELTVTVDDDETASIVLSKASLGPAEGDTMGQSYTVKLSHVPVETITVTLSGHSGTDLALTGPTDDKLTFTSSNWNTAQTVTVKAAEDDDAVNEKVTLTHTGDGGAYEDLTRDLTVTVDDDEEAGIVLSKASLGPVEGSSSGESYTVRLSSEPTATTTVTITGHSGTDLTLTGPTGGELTFTSSNWSTAQTVTVKAAQDADAYGDTATLTHSASGGDYLGVVKDLTVTVDDDETASIVLSKTSLDPAEGNSSGESYTVKLSHVPVETITVALSGHSGTDLALTGPTGDELTFTSSNWDTAQRVTVKAAQDDDAYADTATLIHTGAGGAYEGLTRELTVTVDDDEEAGIVLSKASLGPAEGNSSGESYTVKLSSEPTATTTVTITGHSGTDLTLTGPTNGELTFTSSNWNTAQTVTVRAAQDADAVNETVTLTHTGEGGDYQGLTRELPVTVEDDESPHLVFSKTSLPVNEGETGGASYTVKLGTQPTATTTVTITGHSGTDLTLTGPTSDELTFTSSNWSTARTVTVKAAQDDDAYGDTATLTHSASGGDYQGVVKDLAVTVDDDETASIVLSKTSLGPEEGSSTGESYTVKLSHVPTATITITLSGHSNSDLVVDKETLTFTTVDWDTAQTVMVTASHDDDAVSDQVTLTHTAAGEEYQGLTKALKVTVIEDEEYGVKVAPIAIAVVAGGKNDYTVKLASQPAGEVTVTVSGHAGSDLTLTGLTNNTLTFTSSNWNTAQTVSVSATGSAAAADVTLSHAASSAADSDYNGLAGDALSVTVVAKATNALVIQPGVTTLNQKLTVDEGDSGTYAIVLSHVPSGDVTFTVDDPTDNTDVTAEPASLLFSTSDWNIAQNVTVTAAEDDDASADPVATVKHSVSGGGYDDVTVPDAVVTIKENDSPALVLSKNSLTLEEADTTGGSYTVRLATSPSDTVTVTVGGHSGTDLSLSGVSASNTLTFTSTNWNTIQTVTVTAGEDPDASDDKATLTHTASGGDYNGAPPETLSVSVTDDDRPRLSLSKKSISPEEGSPTGESYTAELATQPTQTVTVTIGGHSGTDLSLDKSSLVFTATNWDAPQTVTVTAAEDEDAVDDEETLNHSASGGDYETVEESLAVTVTDTSDMTVGFDSATYSATEGGSNATVTVQLNAPAPAQLAVPITAEPVGETEASDWEGIPEELTFETGETTKSFMVIAFDDDIEDDGEMVKIGFGTLPEGWVAGSNATAKITLMNDDTPQGTFTLACEEAAWCAELQLADYTALDWAWLWLLYKAFWDPPSTINETSFTFRSEEYTIRNIDVFAGMFPGVDNLWGRSFFEEATLDVKITRGEGWDAPPRAHYQDWVLHLDGLKLPFSQATLSGTSFRWTGPELQHFYLDWTESEITRIGIEETPLADQATAPIPSPRFVTVTPTSASQLSVAWQAPRQAAGFGQIKGYEVQWKAATADWTDATAVSEARLANDRSQYTMSLTGLLENEFYAVRVIATGTSDQSPPSPEVIAKPQPYSPKMLSAVVNGRTLTMRFDQELNTSAVPPPSSFVVLVEGGLREVDSVSIVSSGQPGASNDTVQLTLKRPVSAANTVKARYDAPLDPTANFLSDVLNRYVPYSGLRSAQHATTNETDPAALQPLTANFTNVPDSHDGQSSVTFNIEFSESAWVGVGIPMYNLLQVKGGAVAAIHWLDRRTEKWEVTIQPVGDEDIVVLMPDNRRCSGIQPELGAPCAAGGRGLTNRPEATIPGPRSLEHGDNSPASGGPGIDGSLRVGETISANTSGIQDDDGISSAAFSYQWIRRNLATATDSDIEGATGHTYTVSAEDEGKALLVRVTFTDDAGSEESLTSFAVIISPVLTIPDNEGKGDGDEDTADKKDQGEAEDRPGSISFSTGAPLVGETIEAALKDEDGGTRNLLWQWSRSDNASGTFTDIDGATSARYTPVAGDANKYLKAAVSYDDGHGANKSASRTIDARVTKRNGKPRFPASIPCHESVDTPTEDYIAVCQVDENAGGGTLVIRVSATDPDGDRLTYWADSFELEEFQANFDLNQSTGAITLRSGHRLDAGTKGSYVIEVSVTDGLNQDGEAEPGRTADDHFLVIIEVTP